ncbi:hypothetical protein GCM10010315_18310 [Streptomyces luteosporeus]|uniref:Uncharacterized protein n=1 Tax=Streptomyces luteosporeus TaxID=173856 RepID=A0ABN3TNW2_9ACTN
MGNAVRAPGEQPYATFVRLNGDVAWGMAMTTEQRLLRPSERGARGTNGAAVRAQGAPPAPRGAPVSFATQGAGAGLAGARGRAQQEGAVECAMRAPLSPPASFVPCFFVPASFVPSQLPPGAPRHAGWQRGHQKRLRAACSAMRTSVLQM